MFIFKTIALPHIFRKEKYTKRGRKYYHKRPKSFFAFILKTAAFFWAMAVLAGVAAKPIQYENNFADNIEIEEGAYAEDILNEEKIKSINFENKEINDEPLILIFQTHSNEEYANGKTVKDAGCELAKIFSEKYGITVVHDMGEYDKENGEIKREESYKRSGEGVEKLLEKYPSVKIAVDIHRWPFQFLCGAVCRVNFCSVKCWKNRTSMAADCACASGAIALSPRLLPALQIPTQSDTCSTST